MVDEITLANLLNHISSRHENLSWQLTTKFCDGIGVTLLDITFYEFLPKREKGRICFQLETGEVKNFSYSGLTVPEVPLHVFDLLLDVNKLEQR